jgi:hypothetical protein
LEDVKYNLNMKKMTKTMDAPPKNDSKIISQNNIHSENLIMEKKYTIEEMDNLLFNDD